MSAEQLLNSGTGRNEKHCVLPWKSSRQGGEVAIDRDTGVLQEAREGRSLCVSRHQHCEIGDCRKPGALKIDPNLDSANWDKLLQEAEAKLHF